MDLKIDKNTGNPTNYNNNDNLKRTICSNIDTTYSIPEVTGNCQTFGIAYINYLFNKYQTNKRNLTSDPYLYDYENIAYAFLKYSFMSGKKPQVFIDIQDYIGYEQIVNEIFKDNIVVRAPYTSTNNNKMCLYLLKLEGAKNYIEAIEKKKVEEAKRLEEERISKLKESGQWKEPEFILPEKWYITVTNKNRKDVMDWYNYSKFNNVNHSTCNDLGNMFTSDLNGVRYTGGKDFFSNRGYTEITTEQFKEHVLNKQEKLSAETVDNNQLPF